MRRAHPWILHLLPALALALLPRPAAAQTTARAGCEVRGESVTVGRIRVAPGSAPGFDVAVESVPVVARPGAAPDRPVVRVEGVLRFEGEGLEVPFALRERRRFLRGMLTLGPDNAVSALRAAGDAVRLDAAVGYGVSARGVRLPCDALTLDAAARTRPHEPPQPYPYGDGTAWIPRRADIVLRSAPGAGAEVRLHAEVPVLLSMVRVAVNGAWSGVFFRGLGGAEIEGWARTAELREMPLGSVGGAPSGHGSMGCREGRAGGTRVYNGPARVAVGTPVYAAPGTGAWAVVARDATLEVRRFGDEPWVRLVTVPGLRGVNPCGISGHALVPVGAVQLPAGVLWP